MDGFDTRAVAWIRHLDELYELCCVSTYCESFYNIYIIIISTSSNYSVSGRRCYLLSIQFRAWRWIISKSRCTLRSTRNRDTCVSKSNANCSLCQAVHDKRKRMSFVENSFLSALLKPVVTNGSHIHSYVRLAQNNVYFFSRFHSPKS